MGWIEKAIKEIALTARRSLASRQHNGSSVFCSDYQAISVYAFGVHEKVTLSRDITLNSKSIQSIVKNNWFKVILSPHFSSVCLLIIKYF
jgi:hypothetical protein